MNRYSNFPHRQSGISYAEVLATVVLIAITVIPVTEAIRGSMNVAEVGSHATVNHYRLMARMEEVLADPFSTVSAQAAGKISPSAYSDTPGTPNRRIVYISAYDGDNADSDNNPFTGTDSDLLWLRVEIEGSVDSVQALRTR